MTFPDLPAGVDVIRQPPDPTLLDAFCACASPGCRPVATVTGPDGIDLAGPPCLPRLVRRALASTDATEGRVTVEVPCWNTDALAAVLGIGMLRVDGWARLRLVAPLDRRRSIPSLNYFAATDVHHARALLGASRAGLDLLVAHRLLTGDDADRRLVAAVVARLAQPEKEAAA